MSAPARRRLAWGLVVALALAHHDFWYWSDDSLVLGFLPVGLFYHALLSVGAGVAWALVVRYGWPDGLEEWAGAGERGGGERGTA